MVLITHASEVFYISMMGDLIVTKQHIPWVSFFVSAAHACVPLFVVISGYLLLPTTESDESFCGKRLPKLFIPFILWSLIYLSLPFLWGGIDVGFAKSQLLRMTYNFSWASGHLWFIYMFIGVYLFIPIISPWLKQASVQLKLMFLGLWLFSTCYHYIILITPEENILGESFFSEFSALWYFSGYLGFAVMGHFIKVHVEWSQKKSICIGAVLFLVGFLISFYVFQYQLKVASGFMELALSLRNCTVNVVMMTAGLFLVFKEIKVNSGLAVKAITNVSAASFGIYLLHMLILPYIAALIAPRFHIAPAIIFIALITLFFTFVAVYLLRKTPMRRYLVPS